MKDNSFFLLFFLSLSLLAGRLTVAGIVPESTSLSCLHPKSGVKLTDYEIDSGVPCIAEISSSSGLAYQYLPQGSTLDWDALSFAAVGLVVSPDRASMVYGEPMSLRIQITAPEGTPLGSVLRLTLPPGMTVNGERDQIEIPALAPGEVWVETFGVKSTDPTLIGSAGLLFHVATQQGSYLSGEAQASMEIFPDRMFSLGLLSGRSWLDVDGDGQFDKEEVGVGGLQLQFGNGTTIVTDAQGSFRVEGLAPGDRVLEIGGGVPSGWRPAPSVALSSFRLMGGGIVDLSLPLIPDEGNPFEPRAGFGFVGSFAMGSGSSQPVGSLRWRSPREGIGLEIAWTDSYTDWSSQSLMRKQLTDPSAHLNPGNVGAYNPNGGGKGLTWKLWGERGSLRFGNVRSSSQLSLAKFDTQFQGYEGHWSSGATVVDLSVAEEVVQDTEDLFEDTGGFLYQLRPVDRKFETLKAAVLVVKPDGSENGPWGLEEHIDFVREGGDRIRLLSPLTELASKWHGILLLDEKARLQVQYQMVLRTEETPTWGGRVSRDIGGGLQIGVTGFSQTRETGNYALEGQDVRFQRGAFTATAEWARSRSEDNGSWLSTDGGATFSQSIMPDGAWHDSDRLGLAWAGGRWGGFSFSRTRLEDGYSAKGINVGADSVVQDWGWGGGLLGWNAKASHRVEEREGWMSPQRKSRFEMGGTLGGGQLSFIGNRRTESGVREEVVEVSWRGTFSSGMGFQARQSRVLEAIGSSLSDETEFRMDGAWSGGRWNARHFISQPRHLLEMGFNGRWGDNPLDWRLSREVKVGQSAVHKLLSIRATETVAPGLTFGLTDRLEEKEGRLTGGQDLNAKWTPSPLHTLTASLSVSGDSALSSEDENYQIAGSHQAGGWSVDWSLRESLTGLGGDMKRDAFSIQARRQFGGVSLTLATNRDRELSGFVVNKRYTREALGLSWHGRHVTLSGTAFRLRDWDWLASGDHDVLSWSGAWNPGIWNLTARMGSRRSVTPLGEENLRMGSLGLGITWHSWTAMVEARRMTGDVKEAGQRFELGYLVTEGLWVTGGYSVGGADDLILSPQSQPGYYLRFSGAL
ncbi:hypothetical protein H8D30_02655 [bacterium]|nr:hypothetical protein [bacterium]